MPVSLRFVPLAAASLILAAVPALGQDTAISAAAEPARTVEGATPDRVQLVNACGGHKFESLVEIDPVKHRSTRVKLCSKPGASDSDWVKTLESAMVQIEQRNMPPEAREKLVAELKAEIGNYAKPGSTARNSILEGPALTLGNRSLIDPNPEPEVPFQTSTLPPLPELKAKRSAASTSAPPVKLIRATLRCLERGQSGKGGTCVFLERDTQLTITAIDGLDQGATIRFLRRGDDQGAVDIGATPVGQTRRVALPSGICKGLSYSKVEVLIMAPGSTSAGARFGPYGLRC